MTIYSYDPSGNVAVRTISAFVAPQITSQPIKQVAERGSIVTFSVVVVDTHALTFQWQFNGTAIPGATSDSLLLTNVSDTNEGQYSVVVTNSAGSVTSTTAALLLDSDGDGLPDSWEIANFTDPDTTRPLNPANQRSETDPDKDGVSDLDEFLDGTDPTNNASLRPRLTAYSDAGGSVTVTPMKLSYDLGETVTLAADSFPSGAFVEWTGDLSGSNNPATLTMDSNKTVRARFASTAPLPSGLIALWRGETDASELIGGHNGAFYSGAIITAPTVTASGKVGGAFTFDGTVHIQVPDSPELKPAKITIEAWVFPTAPISAFQTIVARGFSLKIDDTWYPGIQGGRATFYTFPTDALVGPVIPPNQWTFLVASFDGTTKRLYVNGIEASSNTVGTALVYDPSPSVPVTIGADWAFGAPIAYFNGLIDEVTIYDRALTSFEIGDIYNADMLGKNIKQPYFTSASELPVGVVGTAYAHQITTVLGASPISFSLVVGTLPPGITLSSTGLLSGIPGLSSTFGFTVRATDSLGAFTEQQFTLKV